jgi:hypothetical protein
MENQLRSSQLITTYGPGAMVELTDSSIIVAGLDGWKYPKDQACLVSEPRLAAKITKVLRPHSPRKNAILLKSPPYKDSAVIINEEIEVGGEYLPKPDASALPIIASRKKS